MSSDAEQQAPRHSVLTDDAGATAGFEGFIPQVFDWAFRLTRNRDQSMDVVQDVFLKWRHQCSVAPPDKPEAWLRTVTARRVFELSRSPRLRVIGGAESLEDKISFDDALAGPDLDALRGDVFAALQRLTDAQRDVVLAKIMDEKTFATIAVDLGVSVSTVKTHYLRGLRHLRDALTPRWKED